MPFRRTRSGSLFCSGLGLMGLGRKTTAVECHSPHLPCHCGRDLGHLAETRLLHWKATSFFSLLLYYLEKSRCPHPKSGDWMSHLLWTQDQHTLFGILLRGFCVSSPSSINLLLSISITVDSYMFTSYLGNNAKLCYLFCPPNCSSFSCFFLFPQYAIVMRMYPLNMLKTGFAPYNWMHVIGPWVAQTGDRVQAPRA